MVERRPKDLVNVLKHPNGIYGLKTTGKLSITFVSGSTLASFATFISMLSNRGLNIVSKGLETLR